MGILKNLLVTGSARFVNIIKGTVQKSQNGAFYGTCTTAAATAEKVVTLTDGTDFELVPGVVIGVKFSYTNTANNATLNVNSTGAKSIWWNASVYTGHDSNITGYANRIFYYMYDGTYWVFVNNSLNSTNNSDHYTSAQCETAAATAGKTAACSYYTLTDNTYLHFNIRYANTAASALTMNVNSQGAKPIYINGTASSATNHTLPAGSYIAFYDGTNWYFRTDGKLPADISGDATTVSGHSVETTVANDSNLPTGAAVKSFVEGKGYTTNTGTITGISVNGTSIATSGVANVPVPTKVSDLTNDSGYITSYTETDPTVPSWAKQSTKPTYTASEVGALPSTTVIPSKTSDLTNDSGFIGSDSPALTGTPTAPTAAAGTNTTQIATTAFVATATSGLAPIDSPVFTGSPKVPMLLLTDDNNVNHYLKMTTSDNLQLYNYATDVHKVVANTDYVSSEINKHFISFSMASKSTYTITHTDWIILFSDRGGMWTEGINGRTLTEIASTVQVTVTQKSDTKLTIVNNSSSNVTRICAFSAGTVSIT